MELLEDRRFLAADWQNPMIPEDVDGSDGPSAITPIDALLVINELHDHVVSNAATGALPLLAPEDGSPPPFVDVDGNGFVTPMDALLVINQLGTSEASDSPQEPIRAPDSALAGSRAALHDAITNDTLVNTHRRSIQRQSDAAADGAGNTWIVWSSLNQDGSSWGVYGQRYDDEGTRSGDEFRVNTSTRNAQSEPAIAVRSDGTAIVVWQALGQDGSGWGVYGQQFGLAGTPLGAEFLVNQSTIGHQWHPDVAYLSDGSFVVTWEGRGPGDVDGIYYRQFRGGDLPALAETRANSHTQGNQSRPSIAAFGTNSFAIGWDGDGQSDQQGVYLRRLTPTNPGSSEVLVNVSSRGVQKHVKLTGNAQGQLVAAWQDSPEEGGGIGVRTRQFSSFGDAVGTESSANLTTSGPQHGPAVLLFPDGNYVIGWFGRGPGDHTGIFTRNFSPSGVGETEEQRINTSSHGLQSEPNLAIVGNDYLVTWHGSGEADSNGVYSRLFEGPGQQNSAPVIVNPIPDRVAQVGQAFTFNTSTFFADPDAGDTLTYSASVAGGGALPSWLQFNTQTGVLTGTPSAGDVADINITIRAADRVGASVSDTFLLRVTAQNPAPTLTNPIPDQRVAVGSAFNFSVASFFTDTEPLTLSTSARPAWLNFNATTGTFTGSPTTGDVGNVDLTITATDSASQTVSDVFRITVFTNTPPTLVGSVPDQTATIGTLFSLNLSTFFTDSDAGDVLMISTMRAAGGALPSWLTQNSTTGVLSGTPGANDDGAIDIRVTATDTAGASATDVFNLRINAATNRAPGIVDQSFRIPTTVTNGFAVGNVLASDPDGDAFTYAITDGNTNGAFAINAQTGALTVADASQLPTGTGPILLTVTVTQTGAPGGTDTGTVTVFRTNDTPDVAIRLRALDLSGNTVTSITVGQEFDLVILVDDLDAVGNTGGVFSAYADIGYSSDLVRVVGMIVHDSTYGGGTSGDTAALGLIDEAGGTDGTSPLGEMEQEVLRVRMRAQQSSGTASFFTDLADNLLLHPVLRFGGSNNVPTAAIDFGRLELTITATSGTTTGLRGSSPLSQGSASDLLEDRVDQVFAQIFRET